MDSSPRSYLFTSARIRILVYTAPKCGTEPIRYVAVVDPGEGSRGPSPYLFLDQTEALWAEKTFLLRLPPLPYLRVWLTVPPLSEGLDPPLCCAPLSKSTRRSFALLKKLRRNHRGVVFVPAQKPSDIVCAHGISIVNNYLMVSARATVDLSTKVVT